MSIRVTIVNPDDGAKEEISVHKDDSVSYLFMSSDACMTLHACEGMHVFSLS